MKHITLYTEFSPEECERRLQEKIDKGEEAGKYMWQKPYLGTVKNRRFSLPNKEWESKRKRKHGFLALVGLLEPNGTGTRIDIQFRLTLPMLLAVLLFVVPIVGVLGAVATGILLGGIQEIWRDGFAIYQGEFALVSFFLTFWAFLFFNSVVRAPYYLALEEQKHSKYILTLLMRTLRASRHLIEKRLAKRKTLQQLRRP